MPDRPRGRERGEVNNGGSGVHARGDGLGTGPVGSKDGHAGRSEGPSGGSRPSGRPSGKSSYGGSSFGGGGGNRKSPLMLIIILAVVLLGGGSGGLSSILSMLGGDSSSVGTTSYQTYGTGHSGGTGTTTTTTQGNAEEELQNYINSLFGGDSNTYTAETNTVDSATGTNGSSGTLDTSVVSGARKKRTTIKGNGKDTVTMMVYMCGTDLESKSGMATADLQEMASADLGNINIIVYTGGCRSWRNNIVSNSVNQIYQVKNGGLTCLVQNAGNGAMTNPQTLASFIKWCSENYPADRNDLIFWDHGGGSVSGYGYDEKNQTSGSMTLSGINQALKAGGMTFDFIGFDACLMATAENALMLDQYADYLIGSEETEPGVGWYYTNWLNKFAKNTSMATTELGKYICDDFVKECARKCPGQQTTLSVIDLAEFAATVPSALSEFSQTITKMVQNKEYSTVSNARNRAREFAASTRIDQVDLVDLASKLGNEEGKKLVKALQSAVKYNITNNITNASGVSIYFPYKSTKNVDAAVHTYNAIDMNDEYTKAIQAFASMEASGQAAMGGSGSPLASLFGLGSYSGSSSGSGYGSTSGYGSAYTSGNSYSQYGSTGVSSDMIGALLSSFLGGDSSLVSGLGRDNTAFLQEAALDEDETVSYIKDNYFDGTQLYWQDGDDGSKIMDLSDEQWALVHDLDENLWYDDGEGYIDLGLDNVYSFDEKGRLVADTSKAWLGIDGQPVAYYHESTEDDGTNYTVTGRIPCLVNDQRSNLVVVFDNEHPNGYITGVQTVYTDGETETVAKTVSGLEEGDKIDLVADRYDYDGNYEDSYMIGEQISYSESAGLNLENVTVGDGNAEVTYRFTDIYNRAYWSAKIVE